MNKTERAFAEVLAEAERSGLVRGWMREPLSLRLGGRTRYHPDFMVWAWDDLKPLTFVEVKGFMRDDAAVKIKVAAERYDWFRWLLVFRDGRHSWEVREVTRSGIGTAPLNVPWIGGS